MGTNLLQASFATLTAATEHPYPRTSELAGAFARVPQLYVGSVTGTTAALDVDVPGTPVSVVVVNTNNGCMGKKISGMAGAYASKFKASDDSQAYADAMITLAAGKFTIGTDADLNTAHTLVFEAYIL